ncbi:FAD-dependent oxidoreductase [Patescibacteria group bacterium]|nr:FAD-dependent oxidoreductase [Patescibacteria group bacterium]
MNYELIIIGGGPAGIAAGVYASRKKIKTLVLAESFGGQSVVSSEIQNWIGSITISGQQLAKDLEGHLRAYADDTVDIKKEKVTDIKKEDNIFKVSTPEEDYSGKTILVTTGSNRRKLDVPGAKEYENKGIVYCASCDGPLFTGKDVVVIGGGNAAFESASQLLAYVKSVTLLNRSDKFKADEITVSEISKMENFYPILNAEISEIRGETFVNEISYKNKLTGKIINLPTEGVFVEIGSVPVTGFVKDLIELNKYGAIITDPVTQRTSQEGIWAAGDCTDGLYQQNNIAVGDGIKALENIYSYIQSN